MKRLFFILSFLTATALTFAQTTDLQLWTGPAFNYKLNKSLRLEFEQQFRFMDNISAYQYTFSEFGVRYRVFKYLDLRAQYRYTFVPLSETYQDLDGNNKSRLTPSASTSVKLFNTDLKLGYKLSYQYSWKSDTEKVTNFIRNKFSIDYNLSKLFDPYISYESYFKLDYINQFRQNRYTAGLEWNITKKLSADTFVRYQNEINVKKPETDYIIGVSLIYSIN